MVLPAESCLHSKTKSSLKRHTAVVAYPSRTPAFAGKQSVVETYHSNPHDLTLKVTILGIFDSQVPARHVCSSCLRGRCYSQGQERSADLRL